VARAETIATDAKIQLLFYSGSFSDSFFSPMLELSSKRAREEISWATRLRSGLGKTRSRLSGLFTDRSIEPALFEEIEAALLASDAGAEATRFLLAALREWMDAGHKPTPQSISDSCGKFADVYREPCRFLPEYQPKSFWSRAYRRAQ